MPMPKAWQYPRWRRVAMQAAMWGVLGATVGLAALVNRQVRQRLFVELGNEEHHGNLIVRLPLGWTASAPADGDVEDAGTSTVILEAEEPGGETVSSGATRRRLKFTRQRLPALVSPEEYLARGPVFREMLD